MPLPIVTADERLSAAANKTTMALFGPSGVGKTTLVKTLPHETTLCADLEAGMKSVQDWPGDSIPIRCFEDAIDLACLIRGVNPTADPNGYFSAAHHQHLVAAHPDLVRLLAGKSIVFLDSITDVTRQAMAWAKTRPKAFSDRTGKPDTRGAYGLMAREISWLLKHLQHAPGKSLIMVGILERVTDDPGRVSWQPQMEGGRAGRELSGIVDHVVSMALFSRDARDAPVHDPERGTERRLVCRTANSFGLPAKDRSGQLDETEPPDLAALLRKFNLAPSS